MVKNKLVQLIVRLMYPYGALRKVLFGPMKGTKFFVAPSVGLTYALGIDSNNWKFLQKKIKPGAVVYDLGANRGQMSLFFSKMVGPAGKVISFEPMKNLLQECKNNLDVNQLKNVELHPFALSSTNGKARFIYSSEKSTQGRLENIDKSDTEKGSQTIDVETKRIDSLLAEGFSVPHLLKIDVEGAAAAVFEGAVELLRYHPDIYLELHGPDEQKAIAEFLIPNGYKFKDMHGNTVKDPVRDWCSPIWCSVNN